MKGGGQRRFAEKKAWRRMESGGRKRMQACHWHWHPGLAINKVLHVDPLDELKVEGWTIVVLMNFIYRMTKDITNQSIIMIMNGQ